ncbi:MAG: 4-alpha-glucanotransferase, partial [Bacteroidales bacterium]|nr:4-alpha-glucanotransferase [Bacteroidales bacterium]
EYGVDLGNPAKYPYLSVCTTSTHDCETLRMWLGMRNGTNDATPEECYRTIAQNMASPSMLAILPLQDWLSIDGTIRNPEASSERINIPSVADHYWRYRMHITLEDLCKADSLNRKIQELSDRK